MTLPAGTYRQWREQGGATLAFREARRKGAPPERWLQEVWSHQRLRRQDLQTTDGGKLSILHPGFWNREAGPDFLGAIVQFGDRNPATGDVEIDLHPGGWKAHRHAGNAAYAGVILHVVWEPPIATPPLPTLVLRDYLDAPLPELESWVGGAGEMPAEWLAGHCSAPLRQVSPDRLGEILRQAALVRLQTKALLYRARARVAGWHQALWEGVFRALGYKHNPWPMQRVAELLPVLRSLPIETSDPRQAWEARLLGLSGLLPPEPKAGSYARRLWDLWWRERASVDAQILPQRLWRLHGVRPVNHPQRRLALAAAWVADNSWTERIEQWFHRRVQGAAAEHAFRETIRFRTDGYWRRHYTLSSREVSGELPTLGSGRITDIAINVVLPWFWARADSGADTAARTYAEELYAAWSPAEDNAVLKLVRARLFGTGSLPVRNSASVQQGLLQIVRDFCGYSNALCEQCVFPAIIRAHGLGALQTSVGPPCEDDIQASVASS